MPEPSISLLWALHSRCPRGCQYCYFGTIEEHRASPPAAPGELSHLSRDDIGAGEAVAFASSLRGSAVKRVFLAGGEPLAWAPSLHVVAALKQAGVEVVVCTDGTALNKPAVTGRLLDLGVDAVSVSLDSADAAYNDRWRPALNRRDGWDSVVAGIRALLAARGGRPRPLVGIYTVITRLNLPEITGVPRLAAELGCDYAVPQPVSLAPDHKLAAALALTPADISQLLAQYEELYAAGLPLGLPEPDYPGRVAASVAHPAGMVGGCFGGHTLYFIEPDGSVWDCPSALRVAATPAAARRSIRGRDGAEMFGAPRGCPQDCALFSADCVCMWPLTGFTQMTGAAAAGGRTSLPLVPAQPRPAFPVPCEPARKM
jgi:MoaA/NifB/PqqE/SkfB family radical SAM enzyme